MTYVSEVLEHSNGCTRWFAQLQNDCKDIYSAEYNQNKGAIAEDLRNGELSFPVVVALNNASCTSIVAMALESHDDEDIHAALSALRSDHVRGVCLEAMKEAGQGMESLVALWGRRERMQATGPV